VSPLWKRYLRLLPYPCVQSRPVYAIFNIQVFVLYFTLSFVFHPTCDSFGENLGCYILHMSEPKRRITMPWKLPQTSVHGHAGNYWTSCSIGCYKIQLFATVLRLRWAFLLRGCKVGDWTLAVNLRMLSAVCGTDAPGLCSAQVGSLPACFFFVETFRSFFAETFWTLKHFGIVSRSCIKTCHTSAF